MDRLEAFRNIAAQAHRGELAFPTNVNASLKIQHMLDDPECHLEAAARLIAGEPLLSARTVALANSAAYNRSGADITTVRHAVMRLGFRVLRSAAASLVIRQFGSKLKTPSLRTKAEQLWEHTAHVAALAQVIARKMTNIDPETAMFAGIIHEVGGFYLLSRADDFPGLLDGDPEDWEEYGETIIGRSVLKALAVPESVVAAIDALWHGVGALPPESLGDILLLANALAPVASPLHQRVDAASNGTIMSTDLTIGQETLNSILEESASEVQSLVAALLY
ncbi:MAG TPA: HDOD domain-containing protein [Paucimonas sp.]|nr:HDOD domain-containing protein [Paucimonas sp.]